jgi:hypothetical protein
MPGVEPATRKICSATVESSRLLYSRAQGRPVTRRVTQARAAAQVGLPGEGMTPCLAPVATLLNHSAVAPHIVRYGRLAEARACSRAGDETLPGSPGDQADNVLELRALRPCAAGQQARCPAWCLEDGEHGMLCAILEIAW